MPGFAASFSKILGESTTRIKTADSGHLFPCVPAKMVSNTQSATRIIIISQS